MEIFYLHVYRSRLLAVKVFGGPMKIFSPHVLGLKLQGVDNSVFTIVVRGI